MPTVYSVTARGYGDGAVTPSGGIITRDQTFVFETEQQARNWKARNAGLYHSISNVNSIYVGVSDYVTLLNSTKPSIRRRLVEGYT